MDKTKSQSYNFGHEALPILFHTETKQFVKFMMEDPNRFLKFWWDHIGERLEDNKLVPFTNLDSEVKEVPERKSKIIWVRFPSPRDYQEFFMMAFVQKPEFNMIVRWPSTRAFALVKVPISESPTGTFIYELTPRARAVPVKPGPQVSKEAFLQTVRSLVWKKK
ncbi:MAG TPA: hypothetical protein PKD55_16085 [Bellilinea sp.]|nr:hypothetical protein [Bellilinea sp.]